MLGVVVGKIFIRLVADVINARVGAKAVDLAQCFFTVTTPCPNDIVCGLALMSSPTTGIIGDCTFSIRTLLNITICPVSTSPREFALTGVYSLCRAIVKRAVLVEVCAPSLYLLVLSAGQIADIKKNGV